MRRSTKHLDGTLWLREHGLRITPRRIEIVELLASSPVPLTLAEIQEKMHGLGCSFATVFRFMQDLEKKSLVEKVAWVDGSTRHEIRTKNHDHHHYLICRTCKKVEEIEECVVEELENRMIQKKGYAGMTHSLQLSGVCPTCQKAKSKKTR